MRVTGSIMQCQLLETALLNCVNFQTLIATKATRVCRAAAGRPSPSSSCVARRVSAGSGRAARRCVGGCASTSDVLAGKLFDIRFRAPTLIRGSCRSTTTDRVSRIRARFPQQLRFAGRFLRRGQGVRNAITVGLEMRERGERLAGIRIDSGDLAWLSKMARKMLDEAGLTDCGIVLSNDLDEHTIKSILDEGLPLRRGALGPSSRPPSISPRSAGVQAVGRAPIRRWGVDRQAQDIRVGGEADVSGILDVRRYYHDDGTIAGDMVFDVNEGVRAGEVIVDPVDDMRQKEPFRKRFETLLLPLAREGKVVLSSEDRSAMRARDRVRAGLETLDETQLRMLNPHTYRWDLSSA